MNNHDKTRTRNQLESAKSSRSMPPTASARVTEPHFPRLEVRDGATCERHNQRTTRTVTVTTIQDDTDETATEPRITSFHDSLCAFRKYVIHRPFALILPRWQPLNRPP